MVGISARLVRRSRATFRSATQQLSVVVPRRWTLRRGQGCACRRSHRLRTSGPIGRIAAAARRVLMVGSAVECERAARDLRQHEGRVEARAFVGPEERANPGLRAFRERGEVLSGGGFLNASTGQRPLRASAWLSRGLETLIRSLPSRRTPEGFHFDIVIVGSGYG